MFKKIIEKEVLDSLKEMNVIVSMILKEDLVKKNRFYAEIRDDGNYGLNFLTDIKRTSKGERIYDGYYAYIEPSYGGEDDYVALGDSDAFEDWQYVTDDRMTSFVPYSKKYLKHLFTDKQIKNLEKLRKLMCEDYELLIPNRKEKLKQITCD